MVLELLAAQIDGGPGQADGLSMAWLCCCNSFSMAASSASMEVSGGAVQLLLELGQPVVQLAIVATAGLHQLADELDAAGTFSLRTWPCHRVPAVLLEGFPESCQLSGYGSHISFIVQVALLSLSFLYRPATTANERPLSTFCHAWSGVLSCRKSKPVNPLLFLRRICFTSPLYHPSAALPHIPIKKCGLLAVDGLSSSQTFCWYLSLSCMAPDSFSGSRTRTGRGWSSAMAAWAGRDG